MALAPGARLGPYEVTAQIGVGGMGEVYKARDTRLDRTVAIKVLPADVSQDADLRTRFEREARAIAALDHPHICALHDVGEHEGTLYLVMQHLEGETIAARLARSNGPLPLDQALKIAIEIADALDKAHRAGITHRDLKPANVMLTKAGAKLLDFGLAKLRGPAAPITMSGMTRLATPTPNTAQGTILGTVQYMAPEQIEGREADGRADIWALGAVIYEMVTGRRPFDGESPASVIGAILKDTPLPLSARQPLAPRALDQVVGRCLQKDRDERWQSVADLRFALTSVTGGIEASAQPSRADESSPSRSLAFAALSLAIFAAGVGVGSRYLTHTFAVPPVVQFDVLPPIDALLSPAPVASTAQLALSADGRRLAYVALKRRGASQVYIRSIDGKDSRPLPGTDGASFPFWSADGGSIGFFAGRKLKKITLADGAVATLCDAPNGRGGTWNANGIIVFAGTFNTQLLRIPAAGGQPSPATTLRHGLGHTWPQFLPDGRHFLYFERSTEARYRGVYVGDLDNPAQGGRVIDANGLAVYASGYLTFVRDGVLFAQGFDERTFHVSGEPVRVADGVGYFHGITGYNAVTVSPGGALAYGPSIGTTTSLEWFTRSGTLTGRLARPGVYSSPRLSFDQKTVAVSVAGQTTGDRDIWALDVARDAESRMTSDPETDWFPVWSPDGQRIFFASTRAGASTIFQKIGVGQDELLDPSAIDVVNYPDDVSADGRLLAYTQTGKNGYDIGVATLSTPVQKTWFLASTFNEAQPRFAPNMRFVAYASDETGTFEIYVRPYPVGNAQWKVSLAGGMQQSGAAMVGTLLSRRERQADGGDGFIDGDSSGRTASALRRRGAGVNATYQNN